MARALAVVCIYRTPLEICMPHRGALEALQYLCGAWRGPRGTFKDLCAERRGFFGAPVCVRGINGMMPRACLSSCYDEGYSKSFRRTCKYHSTSLWFPFILKVCINSGNSCPFSPVLCGIGVRSEKLYQNRAYNIVCSSGEGH